MLTPASLIAPGWPGSFGHRNTALGVELLANGGFDTDTIWTKGTGWTIAGGVATKTGLSGNLQQDFAFVVGGVYRVTYDVTDYVEGTVFPRFAGGTVVDGTGRTANGSYSDDITALSGNNAFRIQGSGASSFNVDNVSLKRIG